LKQRLKLQKMNGEVRNEDPRVSAEGYKARGGGVKKSSSLKFHTLRNVFHPWFSLYSHPIATMSQWTSIPTPRPNKRHGTHTGPGAASRHNEAQENCQEERKRQEEERRQTLWRHQVGCRTGCRTGGGSGAEDPTSSSLQFSSALGLGVDLFFFFF